MAINFRKSIKILPGIGLNLSKSGISTSIGPRGAKINLNRRGVYTSTGIPGTGIYSRKKIAGWKSYADGNAADRATGEETKSHNIPFAIAFATTLAITVILAVCGHFIFAAIIFVIGLIISIAAASAGQSQPDNADLLAYEDEAGDEKDHPKINNPEIGQPHQINNRFKDKNIFVDMPLFGKTAASFSVIYNTLKEVGAKQQKSINKDTDIVVFMGKKEPPIIQLKKIGQLNNNGANIRILDEIEFIEALEIKID